MVAEPRTWVDVEALVRQYLRDAVPELGRRVFFGADARAELPQAVVFRIAGPDDSALVQVDVWAATKAEAAAVATVVAGALDRAARFVHDGAVLVGASVDNIRWMPDDDSNLPRYIVESTVFATAVG